MSDDIVTRLREPNFNSDLDLFSIMSEAADEIERLRADRDKWKKLAEERNPHSWRSLVSKRYGLEDYER